MSNAPHEGGHACCRHAGESSWVLWLEGTRKLVTEDGEENMKRLVMRLKRGDGTWIHTYAPLFKSGCAALPLLHSLSATHSLCHYSPYSLSHGPENSHDGTE